MPVFVGAAPSRRANRTDRGTILAMANDLTTPLGPAGRGLIFDLDGTLVDTVGARIDGWVEVLAAEGFEVSRGAGRPDDRDGREAARAGGGRGEGARR